MEYDWFYLIMMSVYGVGVLLACAAAVMWIVASRRKRSRQQATGVLLAGVVVAGFAVYMNFGYNKILSKVERNTLKLANNPHDLLTRRELARLAKKFGNRPVAQRTQMDLASAYTVLGDSVEARRFRDLSGLDR